MYCAQNKQGSEFEKLPELLNIFLNILQAY